MTEKINKEIQAFLDILLNKYEWISYDSVQIWTTTDDIMKMDNQAKLDLITDYKWKDINLIIQKWITIWVPWDEQEAYNEVYEKWIEKTKKSRRPKQTKKRDFEMLWLNYWPFYPESQTW